MPLTGNETEVIYNVCRFYIEVSQADLLNEVHTIW